MKRVVCDALRDAVPGSSLSHFRERIARVRRGFESRRSRSLSPA